MTTRILFITDYLVAGGVEHQAVMLSTHLNRDRFAPYHLCLYGEKAGRSLHHRPTLQGANIPLRVLDVALSPMGKVGALMGMVREIRRVRPHIIHTMGYHASSLGAWAKRLAGSDATLTAWLVSEQTPKQIRNQSATWRACERVIINSPHLRDVITGIGLSADHAVFIPNGLDVAQYSHIPTPPPRASLAPHADWVMVMLTRIDSKKSPYLLPEALGVLQAGGNLPDGLRAFIVGESTDADEQARLDASIKKYARGGIITQLPKTSTPNIFYHASDFSVMTSLSEGLPNVVLESLAAGKPVLISEGSNKAGVVTEGVTGWIYRTGDIDHLAERLAEIFAMPKANLSAMREACQISARDYDRTLFIARHEALYGEWTYQNE
jgi:glycosyltransferase involved in cell wall biosynthesis